MKLTLLLLFFLTIALINVELYLTVMSLNVFKCLKYLAVMADGFISVVLWLLHIV